MGLTAEGLKARILDKDFTLAPREALDLFFMFPNQTTIQWKEKEMIGVEVMNLDIDFEMRK